MSADIYPLRMLLLTVSGWVYRHQQDTIAYLVEENRVLKEQLGGKLFKSAAGGFIEDLIFFDVVDALVQAGRHGDAARLYDDGRVRARTR